jgi:hypothetical protein
MDRCKTRNERPRNRLCQLSGVDQGSGQVNLRGKIEFTGTEKNKGLFYQHREKQYDHVISILKNVLR